VLEIACGTGRVTIPIATLGFATTGLDIVPQMLEQARRKSRGLPVRWIEGDARTFDLHEQFHLIFLTGNAFQAFVTNVEQEAMLQRVHTHLRDVGLFAFVTCNPLLPITKTRVGLFVTLETHEEEEAWPSFINVNGQEVRVSRTRVYEHIAQIVYLTSYKRWQENGQEYTKISRTALRLE
jgi:SAM-dependent methyltransferase